MDILGGFLSVRMKWMREDSGEWGGRRRDPRGAMEGPPTMRSVECGSIHCLSTVSSLSSATHTTATGSKRYSVDGRGERFLPMEGRRTSFPARNGGREGNALERAMDTTKRVGEKLKRVLAMERVGEDCVGMKGLFGTAAVAPLPPHP